MIDGLHLSRKGAAVFADGLKRAITVDLVMYAIYWHGMAAKIAHSEHEDGSSKINR